ncbi:MAG: hypothetical protein IPL79_14895 [Myxococcales bacterium]|nr:hypothetical protein [Myxococcales bacterium]
MREVTDAIAYPTYFDNDGRPTTCDLGPTEDVAVVKFSPPVDHIATVPLNT